MAIVMSSNRVAYAWMELALALDEENAALRERIEQNERTLPVGIAAVVTDPDFAEANGHV